ncbi:hypothetical protein CROQUDRAFT_536477 [Cronartium quercuum f. sp. fusiforme G11]|uniref:C2H2-type domain-containing protein n=1 Tax=Cronartium quercuum f. sp. fusiforme G11 TaxID=708437 RepID=A0A9P6NHJ9_9BASI|nr:hypothetical protein CROQUDRAFT_536477 [Cronartium quercuum f. sp. fusiforme G11]
MYHSASPTLHNLSDSTSISSPYLHPDPSHHPFHPVRPNTHAGTCASFGERPGSSYGGPPTPVHNGPSSPFTLASYSTTSRPGTANTAPGLPIYGTSYQSSRPSTSYGTPRLNLPVSSQSPPSLTNPSPVYGSYPPPIGSHPLGSTGISSDRMYNFSTLPVVPRKRARRRYDEIERLYSCSYPGCTKAYGTLNHLNAHITMQKHGPKRLPQEFKEIRKEWRARKKAEAEARSAPYKQGHQAQKNPNMHHHHQSHPHFQSHQNYRVLSNTSSPSALVGSEPNPGSNPLSLMGTHSSSGSHYANVPSGRPHPLMNGAPSPGGGNLINLGQAPISRVLSTGALDSPTLTSNMIGTHSHSYGQQDLLSPLPSSAPAYYASSHYAPPPLGSPAHTTYPPGLASAPRHSSMNYSNHLRPNNHSGGLQPLDRSNHLQSSSSDGGGRSVVSSGGHGHGQTGSNRNGQQDLKDTTTTTTMNNNNNEEKKTNSDTFLITTASR